MWHFSFRLTAPLNLCPIYLKFIWALATLSEHMHKKFEVNWTKIKGGCQLERKVSQLNSYSKMPLVCYWEINNLKNSMLLRYKQFEKCKSVLKSMLLRNKQPEKCQSRGCTEKKFPSPKFGYLWKIHNFSPIFMKLGQNNHLMSRLSWYNISLIRLKL